MFKTAVVVLQTVTVIMNTFFSKLT